METKTEKGITITICPPAEQTVFFQEHQFDRELSGGTDPNQFLSGRRHSKKKKGRNVESSKPKSRKSRHLKRMKKLLEGHKNEAEIMKILRAE